MSERQEDAVARPPRNATAPSFTGRSVTRAARKYVSLSSVAKPPRSNYSYVGGIYASAIFFFIT